MKKDTVFVRHMIDAIQEIENMLNEYTYVQFVQDPIRMHACVRLFEILGEAANKLSNKYKNNHPSIPYGDIIGMRNKLIHHYFEVDLETLWKAYEDDLPSLKQSLEDSLTDK